MSAWSSDVGAPDLGGSGVNVALLVGELPADSPLVAVTDTNDGIVGTAQVRLKVDTRIATPLASVHVPLLAELGSASARITDIDCAPNSSAAVSLGVVTSPAMVAIGTVPDRSEERRVGKECVNTCRSRWWPYH